VEAGQVDAWDSLDCCLRWDLMVYLREDSGEVLELSEALLEAADWARQEERSPWQYYWAYLLELLQDAERRPSMLAALASLLNPEGRADELLALLVDCEEPMRPDDVADRLELSKKQVSKLSDQLERARLIVRRKGKGRATWMFPTPRGMDLVSRFHLTWAS
jgi:DNA-binding MarR family transcriptional regulator